MTIQDILFETGHHRDENYVTESGIPGLVVTPGQTVDARGNLLQRSTDQFSLTHKESGKRIGARYYSSIEATKLFAQAVASIAPDWTSSTLNFDSDDGSSHAFVEAEAIKAGGALKLDAARIVA